MSIRFYCGLAEKRYNYHEAVTGPYACISPVSGTGDRKKNNGVIVPPGVQVLQDSGAFSDACIALRGDERSIFTLRQHRLSFKDALKRQEEHAIKNGYADQIEARVSYDVLIDETWTESEAGLVRIKKRWGESEAEAAVDETVAAAKYLDQHRNGLPCAMSAQGVTPQQYVRCSERLLKYVRPGDIFALGGWCILGRMHNLMPAFYETMNMLIPFLAKEGVKRTHILGVCYTPAIGALSYLCDQYGIQCSTDSVGPSTILVKKNPETDCAVWGYGSWRNSKYPVPPVLESCKHGTCTSDSLCRGLERGRHVLATMDWLQHFSEREPLHYRAVATKASSHLHQMSLFEEAV